MRYHWPAQPVATGKLGSAPIDHHGQLPRLALLAPTANALAHLVVGSAVAPDPRAAHGSSPAPRAH
eukprot:11313868-Alexandrium_andersonii.AAC.1